MKRIIYDIKKSLLIPSEDAEIKPLQYIMISKVLHSNLTMMAAGLAVLKILSGKSWWAFKLLPGDVKLNSLPYVQWILKDWSPSVQLLPRFRKFYGPASELDNLTLVEFYSAEKFYADYVASKDNADDAEDCLNAFVAVLYRVAKKGYDKKKDLDGDIRVPFNPSAIKYYSVVIANWPKCVKQAVLLYYAGCRKQLAELYPEIFPKRSPHEQDNDSDMFGLIRGLAGGKYGDFEKTENLPLHTALRELQCLIAEEEKIKAQTPTAA